MVGPAGCWLDQPPAAPVSLFPRSLVIGLYDQLGLLRFSSGDIDACLAYAALFEMAEGTYTLEDLACFEEVGRSASP